MSLFVATTQAGAVSTVTSGSTVTNTYSNTAAVEYFTVPANVTSITITLKGAEGGLGGTDSAGRPPAGGYQGLVSGTISVTPGQVLSVGVGSGGKDSTAATVCTAGTQDWRVADTKNAVGGTNPFGGYGGGLGGSTGPDGCSGYGGAGGAASVIRIGASNNDASVATIVAGGSGGSGGSGQFPETVGQLSLSAFAARTDSTSTSGQPGLYTSYACYNGILPNSFPTTSGSKPTSTQGYRITSDQRCDGGGGAGGGGGAQGGAQGVLQYGAGVSRPAPEFFGHGANPGQNSTNSLSGLTASYQYYADNNANGSAVISYSSGVPNPPTTVAGNPGDKLVNLYWTAPVNTGNSAITGYQVQYSVSPYTSWTTASGCTGIGTTCTISSLTNSTGYKFQVAAINAIGTGSYSSPSVVITPVAVPTAPTALVATPSDGTISIAFTAATSSISITGYDYSINSGSTWSASGSTSTPVLITGLSNGLAYTVILRANNASGAGAASTSVTSTPLTIPGAPTITSVTSGSSGTSLIVAFVAGSNGGSTITSYQYAISTGANSSNFGTPVAITGTSSPFTISGLSNGTYYTVELRAVNTAGNGPFAVFNNSVTLAAPNAPVLSSLVAGNQSIQVNYTPYTSSTNGGSAITSISYSLDAGTTWVSAGTLTNPFTISGLTNGTSYAVLLKATNGIGSSSNSNSLSAIPITVPGVPTQLSVTAAPTSAVVSWTAPVSTGGSAITAYTATAYSALTGGIAVKSCTTSGALTCTITALTNDTNYYVSVLATNAPAGNGAEAAPRISVIPAALPGAPTIGTITAGSTYLTVPFTAGSVDTQNPITNYQYSTNAGVSWTNTNSLLSPFTISGLTNGTSYSVILRAVSNLGNGTTSSAVSATPYTFPDSVNPATISYAAAVKQVNASWTAPFNGGSQIQNYYVSVFNASVGGTQLTANSCTSTGTPAAPSCLITGLTDGTTYWISIQPYNAAGYGNRSDPRVSVLSGVSTTVGLTSTASTINYNGSVTLTATVSTASGTPTGTMNFMSDGTTITGCGTQAITSRVATCVATGFTVGSHSLTAAYSGSSSYSSSLSGTTGLSVNALAQTITFGALSANSLTASPISISATASSLLSVTFTSSTPSVCTVSGTSVTLVATGTCSINADQAGSATYASAPTVPQSFTVNPAAPGISTPSISGTAQVGTSLSVNALSTTGVVTTTGYVWKKSATSGGTYSPISGAISSSYTPNAADASYYLEVVVTVSNAGGSATATSLPTSAVALIPQTGLAITSLSGTFGTSLPLVTSGGNGSGTVTFSTPTTGCSIIGGALTVTAPKSCSVTAVKDAQGNYASASTTSSVVIGKAASTVVLTLPNNSIYANLNKTVVISATTNTPGVVSFLLDGAAMSGCSSISTSANVATCSWTPAVAPSNAALTATFTPTDSVDYLTATGSLAVAVVGSSLAGVNPSDLTNLASITTIDNVTNRTLTADSPDTHLILTVPGGSLPIGSQVTIYLNANFTTARAAIASSNYLLNFIIAWNASDNTVPSASTPLTLAITNASISKGMVAYVIIGGVATSIGKATVAGSMTVYLAQDPLVVVAPTVPDAPTVVTATSGGNGSSTVSWVAPDNDGGKSISGYTVTASGSGGQSCTTVGSSRSCAVSGLTNGTAYTFTVTAQNVVGTSTPSSQSAAITPSDPPVITTPSSGLTGTYNSPFSLSFFATSTAAISSYAVTSGGSALSALGLSLNTNSGVITGTPSSIGNATIVVQVTDGNNQSAVTSSFTISIAPAASSITSFTVPSMTYGSAVTLSATSSVAGQITFNVGGSAISGCSNVVENGSRTATCSFTPTSTNLLSFTVNFTPTSSNYSALTGVGTTTSTPSHASSSTSFTISNASPTFGTQITLTAVVTTGATGTVQFVDGSNNVLCTTGNLSSGSASCLWTPDNVTTYSVKAVYAGDSNYLSSESSASNVVVVGATLLAPTPISGAGSSTTELTVTFTQVTHASSTTLNLYSSSTGGSAAQTIANFTSGSTVSGLTASTTYYITLQSIGSGNYASSDESSPRTSITTLAAAVTPVIVTAPSSTTVVLGNSVTFTVSATRADSGVLSYQWKFNGLAISGATSATYTFTPPSTASSGSYTVDVTNTLNATVAAITSSAAILNVTGPVSIAAPATGLTGTFGVPYSLAVAGGGGTAPLVYSLNSGTLPAGLALDPNTGSITGTPTAAAPSGQSITVKVTDHSNSTATTALFTIVINLANQALLAFTISPDNAPSNGSAFTRAVSPTLTSTGSGSGSVTYSVTSGTATNCAISSSTLIGTLSADTSGTCLITATKAGDTNYLAATSSAVTFIFTKAAQSALIITSTSGSFGSPLALTTSGGSGTGSVSFAVDTSGCRISGSTLNADISTTCYVTATKSGDTYYLSQVSSPTGVNIGIAALNTPVITSVTSDGTTSGLIVNFTSDPASSGFTAYVYSQAVGGSALIIVPAFATGETITGLSANTTYYIGVVAGGGGSYGDSAESNRGVASTLARASAPVIDLQPVAINVTVGQQESMTVTAHSTDSGTLSYQWSFAGSTLPGATGATYSFITTSSLNSGNYYVVVTNTKNGSSASTTSNIAVLVVSGPVQIATPSAGLTATLGFPYSLALNASGGSAPLRYSIASGQSALTSAGLSLNTATGLISGTLLESGTVTSSIRVTDANGVTATTNPFSITVDLDPDATIPTFSTPVATADGFTVNVTNYSVAFTATASVSMGTITSAVPVGSIWLLTVSGLLETQTATVTVTNSAVGYVSESASVTAGPRSVPTPPTPIPDPVQRSFITSLSPTFAVEGDSPIVVITGGFVEKIVNIDVGSKRLEQFSWIQTPTTLTFTIPFRVPGSYAIQLYNGAVPVLAAQIFVINKFVPIQPVITPVITPVIAPVVPTPVVPTPIVTVPIAPVPVVPAPQPTVAPVPVPTHNTQPTSIMKKISTVQFALNTYYLNAAAKATLQKVAAIIMQSPNKAVLIYGNTDIQKGVDNVWLSHQRAISAFTYIRTFLSGKTIKLGWFAATKPAVLGNSQAAYAKNRRVEIWVN